MTADVSEPGMVQARIGGFIYRQSLERQMEREKWIRRIGRIK